MLRFVNRFGLALILLVAGNAWALGLGDIRLKSALNEPLRAEIQLLSATPEDLENLTIVLASGATFERYGLDRPGYLNNLRFQIIGAGDGAYVLVTSQTPMTEPFLTFLVEAAWARGRLLREYTVLLDPPTFAPPSASQQAVTAPQRVEPRDQGRIERPAPVPAPAPDVEPAPSVRAPATEPAPAPSRASQPAPRAAAQSQPASSEPFSRAQGDGYTVARNQTLWSIASQVRSDSRLTINQTMLAIYEANPDAFAGNINILKAGATLTIPSADRIFQIDRGSALAEVQRQHSAWNGMPAPAATTPAEPTAQATDDGGSLVLVPPDDEPVGIGSGGDDTVADAPDREAQILDRIDAIEAEPIPADPALISIRNDELANLRRELADIRGEVYEPPASETDPAGEPVDPFVDVEDEVFADDATAETADEPAAGEDETATEPAASAPPTTIISSPRQKEGLIDKVLGFLADFWMIIAGVVAVLGIGGIVAFLRGRRSEDGDAAWSSLDADGERDSFGGSTQSIPPPDTDDLDTMIVEETRGADTIVDTVEVRAPSGAAGFDDESDPLEDTFSSETAVNLDQSDPIAEADFHMAYGLYDQAADLVNGALQTDPDNHELLTKLCEIYFVWGNRDAFVDAAQRTKAAGADGAEWDKIVIMGQQIAGESELFAGAGVAGATKEIDLTFDAGANDDAGNLDMVFGDESGDDEGLDFMFDGDDATNDVDEELEVTREQPSVDATAEMPTIERSFDEKADEGTASMPAFDDVFGGGQDDDDATSEIDLDDLGLDLDDLGSFDEDEEMEITGSHDALADTGINEAISDTAETGRNEQLAEEDVDFVLDQTGTMKAFDPLDHSETDVDLERDILAATGKTQVLPDAMRVETINEPAPTIGDDDKTLLAGLDDDEDDYTGTEVIGDQDRTMLAPGYADDDDEGDFDFAKTEALPPGTYGGDDEPTVESPALASTDLDLDLDDLTAALDLAEAGDTVEMPGTDATVEQPRPRMRRDDATAEMPSLGFGDDDDDLGDARTMTEVGTKLDLARAYVDMGDPGGARSILEEVLDEGDADQRKQAQDLLDSLPS